MLSHPGRSAMDPRRVPWLVHSLIWPAGLGIVPPTARPAPNPAPALTPPASMGQRGTRFPGTAGPPFSGEPRERESRGASTEKDVETMPTQKIFKQRVRARMTKTGESYTAARRQLLHKAEAEPSRSGSGPAPPSRPPHRAPGHGRRGGRDARRRRRRCCAPPASATRSGSRSWTPGVPPTTRTPRSLAG